MLGEKLRCKKCGKIIDSVILSYPLCRREWECSKCVSNKNEVLFCERGCKVRAKYLYYGMEADVEKAIRFLEPNKIYTVESVEIGGYISYVVLQEFPNERFNSIHFTRVSEDEGNV